MKAGAALPQIGDAASVESSGAGGTGVGGCRSRGKRLVHDAADGARATSALSAAAEAMVDLTGGPRGGVARAQRCAHVVVGEDVAGADDHLRGALLVRSVTITSALDYGVQRKNLSL